MCKEITAYGYIGGGEWEEAEYEKRYYSFRVSYCNGEYVYFLMNNGLLSHGSMFYKSNELEYFWKKVKLL